MIRRRLRSRIAAGVALVGGIALDGFGVAAADSRRRRPHRRPRDRALVERFADADTTFHAGQVEADIDRVLALGTAGR